jgi:hypothetical protein
VPLKVWYFTNKPSFFDWGNEIIEGFGACFLMPSWGFFEQQICGGRCIESLGVFYQLVNYDCDEVIIFLGATEADGGLEQPEIYPVLATSTVIVSWKTIAEDRQLHIYDAPGRLTESRKLNNVMTFNLDISHCLPRIYMIKPGNSTVRFVVQ